MTAAAALLPALLRGRRPTQVASIVPDLTVGVEQWSTMLGVRPEDWAVYTYATDDVPTMRRPDRGEFAFRLALVGEGPQYELIQPLHGGSIYADWAAERGYTLHHLGFHLDSIAAAVAEMRAAGHEPFHHGSGYGLDGDGGFAYYELPGFEQVVVELIEAPARRRPSERL